MRYDQVYERLARRAVQQGGVDLQTFLEDALASGMSQVRAEQLLLLDLEEGGPIFGKFKRSLVAAAKSSVGAAERQGHLAGIAKEKREYRRLINLAETEGAIKDADPETLEEVEAAVLSRRFTWRCTLINTCHLCLPLHGRDLTMAQWRELGLHPDTIHKQEGWISDCQCDLIPSEDAEKYSEMREPLIRAKLKTKGSKRTQRAVTQKDMEKALAAIEKSRESLEGRRALRLMGQIKQPPKPKKEK